MTVIERNAIEMAQSLVLRSGFPIGEAELKTLQTNDFGLNNFEHEGFVFTDLLRTPFVRMTLMVFLPGQTLPQHKHPPHEDSPGKEESVRTLWGQFKVYVEGDSHRQDLVFPESKEPYYTARKETVLEVNEQFSVPPDTAHWFQAGPEGAVVLAVQNRVNEDYNQFYDPQSTGCPIPQNNIQD